MIVARLVLGTARIAGGASEAAAVALVQSAFDSGVCYVDAAPSYGSGTAEAVVGQALAGHPQIAVTTKLGSARPGQPWLRTFARKLKRLAGPASTPLAEFAPTRIEWPSGSDFTIAAMAQSLEISRERLGRIDLLLLHDVSASEVTAALLESLTTLRHSVGALGGYASYAQWDPVLDQCFEPEMTAQCAPQPGWLLSSTAPPIKRPLRLHSVVKIGLALAEINPLFANALQQADRLIPARDPLTARLAALYALAANRRPAASLLITSSHRARLDAVLAALTAIDNAGNAAEIAALFPDQAG